MANMRSGIQELQRNFVSTNNKLMRILFLVIGILYYSNFQTSLTIVKIAKINFTQLTHIILIYFVPETNV